MGHRPFGTCLGLCSAALLLAAGSAGAQSAVETPVSLAAPDRSAGSSLFAIGDDPSRRLVINGFGVLSASYNDNTGDSSFDTSALALSLFKELSDQVSVFAQLTAARDSASPFLADQPPASRDVATDIDNLQLRWQPSSASGFDVVVGKFDSPLAIERDDAPLNFQATSSFTFDFARPVKFTGVQVHDAFSPSFEGLAIVSNGADVDADNNQAKTAALYGLWSPSLAAHVGLGVIRGAEEDGTSRDPRTTVIATLLFQPAEHLVWGGETVVGGEPHAGLEGGSARWYSQMLFVHARCGPHWAGTVRVDGIDDRDGARTGTRQVLKSFTLSPQYLVGGSFYGIFRYLERTTLRLPELAIRLDLRYDRSTEPVFTSKADGVGRRDHASATLQTVFLF
ncbi:MAG TPA: outer membrane beta-barrel protein [Thermoanaerobaculia bacterium]|nr:outer membrane beta-barrel protein [Thermoanaerobaculia bacterium]